MYSLPGGYFKKMSKNEAKSVSVPFLRLGNICAFYLPLRMMRETKGVTLSPIIMVQWKITLNERKLILDTSHFPLRKRK